MTALKIQVTAAGRAALVDAANTGTLPVTVAQIGVTATAFTAAADGSDLVLPGELKRLVTFGGAAVAADTIHTTIRDDSADTYSLYGFGLYLADGNLFALYGQAGVILEKSAQALMLLATDIVFADIDAAALTFGDTSFLNPPATTDVQGVVELATEAETTTGTDAMRAVTPKGLLAALNARFGAGAPSAFVKGLLTAATALGFRTALAIKGAATYDPGAGNGLDADLLDGQHGAYYRSYANLTSVPATFAPSPHTHPISEVIGLTSTLATLAPLASPALTGTPTAPTPSAINNTTQIATTAFVQQVVANLINGSPGALDTLKELADAMGDDPNFAATVTNALAGKLGLSGGNVSGQLGVTTTGSIATLTLTDTGGNGSNLRLVGNGSTTPNKTIRAVAGNLQVVNSGYTTVISEMDDSGNWTFGHVGAGGSPGAPLDVHTTTGRLLVRNQGTSFTTIDSVNSANNAYAALGFTANSYSFLGGSASFASSITAAGGFQVSDRRFKYNIEPREVNTRMASLFTALWSEWNRKSDDGFDTGLIAQDVLEIAPQYVKVPEHPEAMLAIDKAGIALECALSADIRINQLLARIEKLENTAAAQAGA